MKLKTLLLTLTLCAGLLSFQVSATELEAGIEPPADSEASAQQTEPESQLFPLAWQEPTELNGCSADYNCPPQIECEGTSSCSVGSVCYGLPYIECDGNRTYCPRLCDPSAECCSWQYCDRYYCTGTSVGYCNRGCCECLEE